MRRPRVPFDILELLGMAAGLVAAALFIRHGITAVAPDAGPVARAALALLALAAAVGPFLVRRRRRSLRGAHPGRRAPREVMQ